MTATDSAARPARLPALPPGVRPLPTTESRWLRARYPDLSPSPEEGCPTCRGRRAFRWHARTADGARAVEVVEYACPCPDQWLAEQVLLHAGIGRAYQRLDWDDFFAPPPGLDQVLDYVGRVEDYVQAGLGLLLYGDRGVGKTLIGNILLKKLVGQGVDVYCTSFTDLLDAYAAGWRSPEDQEWFTRRVRNARVLGLDEVGREYKGTKINDSVLEGVLRHRAQMGLPTILMSNLSPADVSTAYGGHSLSLLVERAAVVEMRGPDARGQFNRRLVAEVRDRLTRPVVV